MPKRHVVDKNKWASIFLRLEELVLANSGENEFEEIFKIIVAKLYAEVNNVALDEIRSYDTVRTYEKVNNLLYSASKKWPGIINEEKETNLSPEHLAVCLEVLKGISLSDENFEVLDNLFEYLSTRVAKGSKGQYFTPRHVIEFCIQVIKPKPDDRIVDPACGSGGFLIHALNHVNKHYNIEKATYAREKLWGFDFEGRAIRIAKLLMLLAGDSQANIHRLNSLQLSDLLTQKSDSKGSNLPQIAIEDVVRAKMRNFKGFDIIFTNPPFAGEIQERKFLDEYDLGKNQKKIERDVLFLERCVQLLRSGGRLAIVLPHNKIGGKNWLAVREWLLRRVQVKAVLGLGRNTFRPHTSQKAAVVFGVKRKGILRKIPDEEIVFLISEKDGKDSKGRFVEKDGMNLAQPAWHRIDHDFEELIQIINEQQRKKTENWGL